MSALEIASREMGIIEMAEFRLEDVKMCDDFDVRTGNLSRWDRRCLKMAILLVQEPSRSYCAKPPPTQGVSVNVHENAIVALQGRDGAGKTSTFWADARINNPALQSSEI